MLPQGSGELGRVGMNVLQELSRGTISKRTWRIAVSLAWAAAFVGLAYLCYKLATDEVGFDFRYIWVAGKLWSEAKSPYGPGFVPTYDALIHALRSISHVWVYPPYWLPIAILTASMPFAVAAKLWSALNIGLIAGSAWLFSRTENIPLAFVLAGLTLVDASVLVVWYGQTSALILFGAALLLWSARTNGRAAGILGLVLLALKPNVGAFFFAYMLLRRRFGIAAGAAGAVTLLCLPSLVLFGFAEFSAFFRALAEYGSPHIEANLPPNMTGAVNLLSLVVSSSEARILCMIGMLASTAVLASARWTGSENKRVMGLIVATLLFVPLHDYDLSLLVLPLLWIASKDRRFLLPALAVFGMLVRPAWIVSLTGLRNPAAGVFQTSLLVSLAIIATSICLLYWFAFIDAHSSDGSKSPCLATVASDGAQH